MQLEGCGSDGSGVIMFTSKISRVFWLDAKKIIYVQHPFSNQFLPLYVSISLCNLKAVAPTVLQLSRSQVKFDEFFGWMPRK